MSLEDEVNERKDNLYTDLSGDDIYLEEGKLVYKPKEEPIDLTEPLNKVLGIEEEIQPQSIESTVEELLDALSYHGALEQNKVIAMLMQKIDKARKDYIEELKEAIKQLK